MGIVLLAGEAVFTENVNLFDYRIFGIVPLIFVHTNVFPEFCQFKVSAMPSFTIMPATFCHLVFLHFFFLTFHDYFSFSYSYFWCLIILHYLFCLFSLFFACVSYAYLLYCSNNISLSISLI